MNKPIFATGAVALVIGAATLYVNYKPWFVFPKFREVINSGMKDPTSTQYRNERLISEGWLCGEINSKNGAGGYVGFKKYIVSTVGEAYLEEHGYVGNENFNDKTKRVIEKLEEETKIIEERNALRESTGIQIKNLSAYERSEEATRRIFNKKWTEICGI